MSSIFDAQSKPAILKPASENIHLDMPRNPQIIKPAISSQKEKGSSGGWNAVAVLLAVAALSGTAYSVLGLLEAQQLQEGLESRQHKLMGFSQSLEARSQSYAQELDSVRQTLDSMQSERLDLQKEVNRSRIEISNLEKTVLAIQEKTRKFDEFMTQIASAPAQNAAAEAAAAAAPSSNPEIKAVDLNQVPSAAQAPQPEITVSDEARVTPQEAPLLNQPQVMTINRKFNFVVVNAGLNHSLKMGDRLRIERAGKSIAAVEIEKLYDSFSAATIVEEKSGDPIQEGDSVEKA
ncbi:MAG: hypothetical protein FGM27_09315 [Candidatus Omnitrophica bacterium]|nr:hypothetical protein [Candidatus Omnitrophota bacterium]